MQIKEIMRTPVTIEKDISLSEAAKLMSEKRIGSLILVDKGKIKGIITERDLLKNFGKSAKVSDIMSTPVVSTKPKEQIEVAVELMKEHQIKRLPVVEKDQVVGIVSLTDVAAHFDELEGDFFF